METQHFLKIHYLSGAILIQNLDVDSLLYSYSDFQGSLIALTDVSGNEVEKYAYVPWGARRNPDDWTQKDLLTKWITNRGYTGHEHLDAFGIINMNVRVYDPLTAMFFSPDPYVQAPGDWLNYNRYGYAYGNPFKYTDPSGNNPLLIAAFLGGIINVGLQILSGNIHNVGNFFTAFGVGVIAGLTGAWAGAATSAAIGGSSGFISGAITGAAGGAVGGIIGGAGNSWMNGANFGNGLIDGLKGAGMGALADGLVGGIFNGIDAIRNGTNFWSAESKLDLSTGYGAENVKNTNLCTHGFVKKDWRVPKQELKKALMIMKTYYTEK